MDPLARAGKCIVLRIGRSGMLSVLAHNLPGYLGRNYLKRVIIYSTAASYFLPDSACNVYGDAFKFPPRPADID